MADRVGFEPTVRSHAHTLSKRAHSTTLTPVRLRKSPIGRGGRKLSRCVKGGNTEIAIITRIRAFHFLGTSYETYPQYSLCRKMEIQERYEIRRKLGQGGVGAVYEGYDHKLRRRVAVKRLLDTEESRSGEAMADLLKECHSLSALNSPNIVQLFDFGEDNDGPFVVMELLEGHTLENLIEKAPFTEVDFMVLAEQSLEGLLAAHAAHLLHRDLKPCNFMVTWLPSGRMQLKILDFGLAKFSVEPTKQTIAHGNSLFGSIYFMAPEQFEQLPLDGRTDLYALGSVFYYALTGIYPFNGESVAQVMASHLSENYRDLREYRPDLNPEISKWVMSLMSRNPEHRPDSCATALAQFMGIQRGAFSPQEPVRITQASCRQALQTPDPQIENQIPAQTATVSLRLPGAERNTGPIRLNTGRIMLNTGSIPLSPHAPVASAAVGIPASTPSPPKVPPPLAVPQAKKSKSTLYATITGLSLVTLLGVFFSIRHYGQTTPLNAVSAEKPETRLPQLRGEELVNKLALPDDVVSLVERRDTNKDNRLSEDEFAVAPLRKKEKILRRYFPLLDLDGDKFLSITELDQAYLRED